MGQQRPAKESPGEERQREGAQTLGPANVEGVELHASEGNCGNRRGKDRRSEEKGTAARVQTAVGDARHSTTRRRRVAPRTQVRRLPRPRPYRQWQGAPYHSQRP